VFEHRYRAMLRDAMAGRGEIVTALLKPGYEGQYRGSPPVHDVGCLGSVENVRTLPDGRSLLELVGLSRVRFETWEQLTPYRIARCRPLPDREPAGETSLAQTRATQLAATFQVLLQELSGIGGPIPLTDTGSVAQTVNRICFALDIEPEDKQLLLMEDDLVARADQVGKHLDALLQAATRHGGFRQEGPVN
jgi:Lon protease-like protein